VKRAGTGRGANIPLSRSGSIALPMRGETERRSNEQGLVGDRVEISTKLRVPAEALGKIAIGRIGCLVTPPGAADHFSLHRGLGATARRLI